jgi:protocatechuate 4,5-dioxygenase alpha chain
MTPDAQRSAAVADAGGSKSGDTQTRLPLPAFDLDEPGTIEFTAERALGGQALNRFALSLRSPARRAEFLSQELAVMLEDGLSADEIRLVQERDWTGMLLAGGHLQAILKLAATVGQDLWVIGAHNAGCERAALIDACPRTVSALPGYPR